MRRARYLALISLAVVCAFSAVGQESDVIHPTGVPEPLTPFLYKLPFEYLGCHISAQQNIAFLGFDNKRRQEVNFRQIFHSAQAQAEPKVAI